MKIPKIKLKTLITFALAFWFMATYGLWTLMAVLFGFWALARVLGVIFRSIGATLRAMKQISDGEGEAFEYLFHKKF